MNYTIVNKNTTGNVSINVTEIEKDVSLLKVDIHFTEPCIPQPIKITWEEPCIDILAVWKPDLSFRRFLGPNWSKQRNSARLASGAPICVWLSNESMNRLTVTISDAETPTEIFGGVIEENANIDCGVTFFTQPINPIKDYHAEVLLDRRNVRYEDAIGKADNFWKNNGYPCAYVPQSSKEAVYSCWYSFHQAIDVPAIIEQCRIAKTYGMKTVIVDDGWQTEDESRGYAFCGDWQVASSKIADMHKFVEDVHKLGMRFILWYSVPFVGKHAKAYEKFHDMTLGSGEKEWEALDPRYPEVREYLTGIYVDAVKNWDLDGFKLDFIDSFCLNEYTKSHDERWDTPSLEEGIDRLLKGVSESLKAIKPDIMIEFRQTYFGPAIRKYGNMIRVADCPDDPMLNRISSVDLRFVLGNVPVHSDMLMWRSDDTAEAVAYQMITTLFCVPQISVLLDKISQSQQKVLKFYLDFWQSHRETLLGGTLQADHPESLYSQVRAESDLELIAVAYTNQILKSHFSKPTIFINAAGDNCLYLHNLNADRLCKIIVYDCFGDVTYQSDYMLTTGVHAFQVPNGGMLVLK